MLKFIRGKGHHVSAERQKLQKELFSYNKLIPHGFTHQPSSFAWDPKLNLIAIGTRVGFIRIYGTPGVEFYGQHGEECCVTNLFFIPNQGRLISLCDDNSLHLWELNTTDGEPSLIEVKSCSLEGSMKKISSCCLQSHGQHLLIGTEGGNIYLLDVKAFEMTDRIIYQDVIMQNVSDDYKLNPGAVEGIAENPSDPNLILIGYNRGLMVLWDMKLQAADKTYTGSQQLESVTWYRDGTRFMSTHNDGSYIVWTTADPSKPYENPKTPYGPFPCKSMKKMLWLSVKGEEDFVIFSGGMPRASYGDRHTVTVMKGDNHQVLDFTSKVVDFVAITDSSPDAVFDNPRSLVVLVEEELVAIDLETEGWPAFRLPYLSSLHTSAITCTHHCSHVPQDLWDRIVAAGNKQIENHYSSGDWPVTGGKNLLEPPTVRELILTGHEDGTIRFWDASGVCLKHLYTLRTGSLFEGEEHEQAPVEEGEEWPPFRKMGNFDPYSDDPRLAVKKIILCVLSGVLVVAGTAGQVIVFEIKDEPIEKEVEVFQVNIVEDRDSFVWKGHDQLDIKGKQQTFEPGFQHIAVIQLKPPAGVTALELHSEWGLVAAGTAHGLELFDYVQKQHVISKCTLNPNDLSAGDTSMTRRKSFKKSLRESFRRLRKGRSQQGKRDKTPTRSSSESPKDASATDVEVQAVEDQAKPVEHQIDDTSGSVEGPSKSVERQVEARAVDDSLGSIVRCLYLAKNFIVSCVTTTPTLWAGTNAGTVYIFTISLPDTENRGSGAVSCRLVKEIQLKHRAPVMYIHVVDHNGYPLPDPLEVEKEVAKPPDFTGTHRVLICSEEQFKVFTLPNLKPYRKFKVTAHEGSHVRKVAISKFTSESDSSYSEYCMICLTNQGDLGVYSIPDLRRQLVHSCTKKEDITGISSLMCTKNGQGFFLHSPCEFFRFTLSSKSVTKARCLLELPEGARPATETPSSPEETSHLSEDVKHETTPQEVHTSEFSPIIEENVEKDKVEGNEEEKRDGMNDDSALSDEEKKELDITVDSVKDHLANLSVEDNSFVSVELTHCSKTIKTQETNTTIASEVINRATVQAE